MAPIPERETDVVAQDTTQFDLRHRTLKGDEVVISGISGIFPKSNSVQEFMENLYNKVDMVKDEKPRWLCNHPEVPTQIGEVSGLEKFDAQFFKVHFKQAVTMAPMCRKMLEQAYGAIFDAGVNSKELHGKKVGVFIGFSFSEYEKILIFETVQKYGLGITGCSKTMYANRISYWIDGKGPSYGLDVACATSAACVEQAYRSIKSGECQAAIVGACNLCMLPCISLSLKRLGFLCMDGKTKSFDENADGYARADAINVMFLQRAKDAKRIYSEVYHAKGNFTLSGEDKFMPFREPEIIEDFLNSFYSEVDVLPQDVEYVEGHASGINKADKSELEAIGRIFCKGNKNPILVGSVKSNMGHSESASGICSMTKICLAYHKGKIAANLHCLQPRTDVKQLREGSIEVVREHAPFKRGFVALNNFSYTGANFHILMKGHFKEKNLEKYKCKIPYLILASGRQESCVKKIINSLKSRPLDAEEIALLHNIHKRDITGHMCRGYVVLDTGETKETVTVSENIDYFPGVINPVWFVYSGMGSQWAGMGKELMRIPIYAKAIQKCHKVLESKEIDLIHILTEPDKTIYDNILNSFIGIAAVQIGLTDVLKELGIEPDHVIGHSVGEMGCAYADNCFNVEEMMLSSYYRGIVSTQTPFIRGSMAAIGICYKAILPLLPHSIEVACHNSSESCTISGPCADVETFVKDLQNRGVFAKEVACSNIAYHSRYIADAGPELYKYLKDVIKDPKERSSKWVSTSVPQIRWHEPIAKHCSAEYHTNNLLSPVLFEETAKLIPSNAIVIEIAPHGLLQAILKRSLPSCIHIPLTRRESAEPIKLLLESIGKLYEQGLNPNIAALYPKVEMPVSTETPLLSHLVEWEHSEDWPEAKFIQRDKVKSASSKLVMSIHDDEYKYLGDHVRGGMIVYPESAILVLVWETLAMWKGVPYQDLPVIFEKVRIHGEVVMTNDNSLKLNVMIHKGSNDFEVTYENSCIMDGVVVAMDTQNLVKTEFNNPVGDARLKMTSTDIYKLFNIRGHYYGDVFQTIQAANTDLNKAQLKWTNEWVTFIDSIIQFANLSRVYDGVSVLKCISKLIIDVNKHAEHNVIILNESLSCYDATMYKIHNAIICGGVQVLGIDFIDKPSVDLEADSLQKYEFVSNFPTGFIDMKSVLQINLQIISDNLPNGLVNITELKTDIKSTELGDTLREISANIPTANFNINFIYITESDINKVAKDISKSSVIILANLVNEKILESLHEVLSKKTFILIQASLTAKTVLNLNLYNVISAMATKTESYVLIRKKYNKSNVTYLPITHDYKFSWVQNLQDELQKARRLVLVSQKQSYCGLFGLVQKLRTQYGDKISFLAIDDYNAPNFDPQLPIYKEQLNKRLSFNVLKMGHWGGYYYLPGIRLLDFQQVKLVSSVPGNLDSLTWVEDSQASTSRRTVQVHYAGLCSRDAQIAAGRIHSTNAEEKNCYGMDFSGIDDKGQRLMGLIANGSISSTIEADPDLVWPVPEHWSLEDAATVPLAYVHAFYCLTVMKSLQPKSSVLIHGGAGALGQAAIAVALALGCNVFTTVSCMQKKIFLMKLFPQINENHIGNSRADFFEDTVMSGTNGEGCQVVINCISRNLRRVSMRCCSKVGIFLDVTEEDMYDRELFEMYFLSCERTYRGVQLSHIFKPENVMEKRHIQSKISEGIARGYVRPLTRVVYPPSDATKAFRLLAGSRHRGRVLLRLKDSVASTKSMPAIPRMSYSSEGSFVVISDQHELGVELADRLIRRGAKHVVINIEPIAFGGYLHIKMSQWQELGVNVKLSSENLQNEEACINLLQNAAKLAPVEGIFVTHITSQEKPFKNIGQDDFIKRFDDRALVVAKLDGVSKNMCLDLKYFVVITNETTDEISAFMNSLCERICQMRLATGLPALVIKTGLLNKNDRYSNKLATQNTTTVLNAIDTCLKLKYHSAGSYNIKKYKDCDLLGKISNIIGHQTLDKLPGNIPLKDLSANSSHIEEIKNVISKKCNKIYSNTKIRNLSIQELREMERILKGYNTPKEITGLETFFTYIEPDEYLATDPLVPMDTKLTNVMKMDDEFDREGTYLMLIPGFDGLHPIFQPICERLKILAMTLQLGPEYPEETVQETALRIYNFLKIRFDMKDNFYLLGYSFGVLVALELAALLEEQGNTGKIFCLDSSPDVLCAQLDANIGDLDEKGLENAVAEHIFSLMSPNNPELTSLRHELSHLEHWPDKISVCIQKLKEHVHFSNQYKSCLINVAYQRIKQARQYKPSFQILRSELILLRGTSSLNLPADYNLSKYTQKPVRVYNLESDHATAPYDLRCSNVVNGALAESLRQKFNELYTCESYYADLYKVL